MVFPPLGRRPQPNSDKEFTRTDELLPGAIRKEEATMRVRDLLRRYARGDNSFREADLHGADLTKAILAGVDLASASLDSAILRDADLRFAVLQRASLAGAILIGADFTGAD